MGFTTHIWYLIINSFAVYFIICYVFKKLKIQNIEGALLTKGGLQLINLKHVTGILLFGVLFFLAIPESRFLIISFEIPELKTVFSFVLIVIISAVLSFKSVKNKLKNNNEKSPYKLNQAWIYFIVRVVFLLSYEFFFRGVLFFSVLEVSGLIIAIVCNTLLYVLIHIFDSKQEILGAIPFGIVLCLLSYNTNTIWMAFLIHTTLSVVYEFSMFKHLTFKSKVS